MNKYVIAFLSMHTGELVQCTGFAESSVQAMNMYLDTSYETEDEIYDYVANIDAYVSCLEISTDES